MYDVTTFDPALQVLPVTAEIISFPIQGVARGNQTVKITVTADVYYKLGHVDGRDKPVQPTPNNGNYTRVALVDVGIGEEFIPSANELATGVAGGEDVRLVTAEVTGIASGVLLLPSLLFGGTFGRGSRKLFNNMLGGAKRRVMFHNVVSLGLTLAAVVHIVFFLLEIRYSILMGVIWGGLGALSLLLLGLTGYYQVTLIQRYGYRTWRVTHLAIGLLVMIFVAMHSILDGPDFFAVKEQMPDWFRGLQGPEEFYSK